MLCFLFFISSKPSSVLTLSLSFAANPAMNSISKLWGSPLNIDESRPVDPNMWPEIFTFKPEEGIVVLFYRTENGTYKMRLCIDDFKPIDFKPFELKNIASVKTCFLLRDPPKNTLSVSRPGDLPELIQLVVATPGDFETSSPSAAPNKPKDNQRKHAKGSTSGGHRNRGPSTTN